jgi:hypothetical protein
MQSVRLLQVLQQQMLQVQSNRQQRRQLQQLALPHILIDGWLQEELS